MTNLRPTSDQPGPTLNGFGSSCLTNLTDLTDLFPIYTFFPPATFTSLLYLLYIRLVRLVRLVRSSNSNGFRLTNLAFEVGHRLVKGVA